ncbi:hypothetical protein E3T26_14370 [Cryobacterium sp. TMT1-21]|uniref:hypothetical protein n=1 Tax=Cryobacterium sp. TMT1-21 TaxID=1259234 RepID=UPI00106DCA43|nr:hypothetical protein [Cryobacterium sp. TMT1-21]TFD09809.1 hypothetical protein E3T26_14370 [Cryobacterium sp. TMT1-21]
MVALLPIEGTVSVTLDGSEAIGLGMFSIPVNATLDAETGMVSLKGVTNEEIMTAMAGALRSAADQILATLQTVKAEIIAVCPTCDAHLGVQDASTTIEHGLNGGHIESRRY